MTKATAPHLCYHPGNLGTVKKLCTCLLFMICAAAYGQVKPSVAKGTSSNFRAIESGFTNIPDSVQTSVYWYWISGNISKEGVIKDLEAMKKVGINRAFIGNIGLDNVPAGRVKMFSDEWWDILHTALKTATKLNIQIGLFNSPGWSQSGGPWVKPEQSMRYLTSSKQLLKGPALFNGPLLKPKELFQDVKVLAYPVAPGYGDDINGQKATLSSEPEIDSLGNLIDHDPKTAVHLKGGQQFSVEIKLKEVYPLRSLTLTTMQQPVRLAGEIQVKVNDDFVTLKHFKIERSNPAINTGFVPYPPAAISLPVTTAKSFRVVFTTVSNDCGITELKFSGTPVVENYDEKTLAKMWPNPHPFWDAYQWPQQPDESSAFHIDPAKVIDISKFMTADGTLKWNVPAGNWIVERAGMTPTTATNSPAPPEGTGLETDKMSKLHIAAHFQAFLGEVIRRIPAADRRSWKVTVEDSYETGGQNWTDDLIAEFKQKYNYDPTPYIPVLQGTVIGSEDQSDRFLWDLRRLIADDVSFKYVGGLREISHKYGLTTWLENYGHWGFPGEFLQYGGQSDEVGGEFWSEGDLGDIENRAASSSAHIYGKTKVSAESFTAAGAEFRRYPAMFKKRGDRFFTEGINNTLMHVYIQQPKDDAMPGFNAWFGVEFNRLNTWFYDMDVFLKYIKRSNMMLQQGQYVADVAYFIGEDAPKMIGVTDPALPQGYAFDYINGDVIKQRLKVKNGKLVLPNGISYSVLVLPRLQTIRPELLAKIKELVNQGAVILGPKPGRSPSLANYPAADQQVQGIAAELWGNADGITNKVHHYGKGLVINGMDLQQALDLIRVKPDLKITNSEPVLFIHRKLNDGAIYFISNQKDAPVKFSTAFRITGKIPELWDAVTGTMRNVPVYTQHAGTTNIHMQLEPYESAFVIFRKNGVARITNKANYPTPIHTTAITQPWTVTFDKAMRGPANPVVFNTLTDWSVNANDSIKYYSGTAYYHNTFKVEQVTKGANYFIDLGLARAIAKVKVNGIAVGGAWTPPYRLDITKALKPGENNIEIKVVNTWANRLVGDQRLPKDRRKTSANFSPDAKASLESSGLLGPVKIDEVIY